MKSRDPNPSVALLDDGAEPSGDAADGDADTGRQGHLPIAVSEGDFATPTKRTRTITKPRGLRTLEPPLTPPPFETPAAAVPLVPDGVGAPSTPPPRHEASVVDEFLAAPPTPQPEVRETPAPEVIDSSLSDELGFHESTNAVENVETADQLRQSALGATVTYSESDSDFLPESDAGGEDLAVFPPLDLVSQTVDAPLDDASAQIVAAAPARESISGSFETGPATSPPDRDTSKAADVTPSVTVGEISRQDGSAVAERTVFTSEPGLSPLAQTLANMAESMHGELTLEPAVDLDIGDGPLLPLAPERADGLVSSSAHTPVPRSTPPPVPTAILAAVGDVPAIPISAGGRPAVAPLPLAGLPEALVERPRRSKRSKPWFEEVFDESYLRTLPFMTAEQTLQEVDFIESSLSVPRGSEILDVACGYGRHAIELVQRGLSVTGVDLSLPLLIRAADESQRRAVSVNFVHTDMREMSFERQFSGAYCMLTSFGYFDDESNLKVAEGIARALKPGGRFLIDVVNRDYVVSDLPARVWWEGDGCVVLEEVDFNFNTNRVLTHRSVVFEDGQQLEQEISVRVYSLHDLGKLLRQAGFRVLEVSGSIPTRGHFFGAHSRNLLILAERRPE